jgi:hypothetical protein
MATSTSVKITCVKTEHPHRHIVSVEAGGITYTVNEVIDKLAAGWTFYTVSPVTNDVVLVHKYKCWQCDVTTLKSAADAVTDNNLDNLPVCK